MQELRGRCAVVTGAASGIGRGIARAFADAGVHVVVADIDEDGAKEVEEDLRGRGVRSVAVGVDVASLSSVTRLADVAYESFGAVDILCNNAGVSLRPFRAIWNYSYEDWKFMIDVNLWGVIHGMHVFIPRMRAQPGDKHIVNTSSEGVLMNMRGHCGYIAAKAGVCTLSEVAAKELADERIGMTVLLPGSTATSIATSERLRPAAERSEARQLPEYETPEIAHYLADRSYRRDPDDVGRLVLEAIEANQLLLLTHPAPQEVTTRTNSLLAGPGIVGSVSGDAGTEASVRGSVSA